MKQEMYLTDFKIISPQVLEKVERVRFFLKAIWQDIKIRCRHSPFTKKKSQENSKYCEFWRFDVRFRE